MYLRDVPIMELVFVFGVVYISAYGSMLIVWCILSMYLVSCNILHVLILLIFYGGLVVVSMLIVMPNGNAQHYYPVLIGGIMCSVGLSECYIDLLIGVIGLLVFVI